MKYILKDYQQKAVDKLMYQTKWVIAGQIDSQEIVFKAPTGSGKTIMMAAFLEELRSEDIGDFAFVWVSVNKLHTQSKISLENTLWVGAFLFLYLENIREKLWKNNIVFINWESITKKAGKDKEEKDIKKGDYTNIFMSPNEQERNLPNFIENTKVEGRKIILIIDESHIHLSEDTEKLILEVIKPDLRIEVSATPKKKSSVEVSLEEVIDSGMIKKEVIINEKFSQINLLESTSDEVIIEQALAKWEELKRAYEENIGGKNILPLVLIQIPGKTEKTSVLEKSEIEKVQNFLKERCNITLENKKLAIWLSEQKENLENISEYDNEVEVLIFKQAIATGWDCPRAQILVMFREIKSITFEIQTVGRIMRMPELSHYANDVLNRAYVYTNFWKIHIEDGEAKSYVKVEQMYLKTGLSEMKLPWSVYLHRKDYNDLEPAAVFQETFYEVFLDELGGIKEDFSHILLDMLSENISLTKLFKTEILLETKLIGIDILTDYKTGFTKTDEKVIEYSFKKYLEKLLSWKNKSRSVWVLKSAFYNFFNHYLWFREKSSLEIQKIILTNQDYFAHIFHKSYEIFRREQEKYIEQKQDMKISDFSLPVSEVLREESSEERYKRFSHSPCMISHDSQIEKKIIEQYLEKENTIEYWYKNWVSKDIYFWVLYEFEWRKRVFYPDFLVKYKDGKIGIFDTKDGNTAGSMETRMKAEALHNYCKKYKNIISGIIIEEKDIFYLNSQERYEFVNDNLAGWEKL